jgi:protein disulfide-isomerase A1
MKRSMLKELYLVATVLASSVQVLNSETLDNFLNESNLSLVKFYVPNCPYSQQLAPAFEAAASDLEDIAQLGKINCYENEELCQKYEVSNYPTLKVFRNQKSYPYRSARTRDAIVSYMNKQSVPPVVELTSATIDEFKSQIEQGISVIARLKKSSEEYNSYYSVAETLRGDIKFAFIDIDSEAQPEIKLLKPYDEKVNTYSGDFSSNSLEGFIKVYSMKLLPDVGEHNFKSILAVGNPIGYFFYESDEQKAEYEEQLQRLAGKFREHVLIAAVNASIYGDFAESLSLEQRWPAFAIQTIADDRSYPFHQDEPITIDNLDQFLESFVLGNLSPTMKSDPIPLINDGPVKIVVGDEFEDIVFDADKDVLVAFHARIELLTQLGVMILMIY